MARYTLRNQDKIEEVYSKNTLIRILSSLDIAFQPMTDVSNDIHKDENSKYDLLLINDIEHSCGMIIFYIIGSKFDIKHLAFKEIAN